MSGADWVNKRVRGLDSTDLHAFNKAINERIAHELADGPVLPDLTPATDQLPEYLLGLGYNDRPYEGLSTGLDDFDHLIGGLNKFVLLAARAGVGKSTLAVQLALGAIQSAEVPVLFYSFEMARRDVFTMMLQNLRRGTSYSLTRKEIILAGNKPISTASSDAITEASGALQELSSMLYVVDATDGNPTLDRVAADISRVKEAHGSETVLVIVDSVQDLVHVGAAGATAAEAETAQQIVEIQQATDATFLAISQKAKGGNFDDPYAAVLGSVSLIHKPTAVVELLSVYDLLRQVKDRDLARTYTKLAELSDVPNPVIARVIKGRNNGTGHVPLMHYGKYGYFEVGKVRDFDVNPEGSLYDLNAFGS